MDQGPVNQVEATVGIFVQFLHIQTAIVQIASYLFTISKWGKYKIGEHSNHFYKRNNSCATNIKLQSVNSNNLQTFLYISIKRNMFLWITNTILHTFASKLRIVHSFPAQWMAIVGGYCTILYNQRIFAQWQWIVRLGQIFGTAAVLDWSLGTTLQTICLARQLVWQAGCQNWNIYPTAASFRLKCWKFKIDLLKGKAAH